LDGSAGASMLFKDIIGVRLFEESLIIVCAGRLHAVLHAGG